MSRLQNIAEAASSFFRPRFKILAYHFVGPSVGGRYEITQRAFGEQMDYLKTSGFSVISLERACEFMSAGGIPERCVVITFDDGHATLSEYALPLLQSFGFPYTVFLPVDHVKERRAGIPVRREDKTDALTWEEIERLAGSGAAFGSHTMTHRALTSLSAPEMECELMESKKILDQRLHQNFVALAYPFGRYDQRVTDCARRCGYSAGLSFGNVLSNAARTDLLRLRREQIVASMDQAQFARAVNVNYDLPRKIRGLWHQ